MHNIQLQIRVYKRQGNDTHMSNALGFAGEGKVWTGVIMV